MRAFVGNIYMQVRASLLILLNKIVGRLPKIVETVRIGSLVWSVPWPSSEGLSVKGLLS